MSVWTKISTSLGRWSRAALAVLAAAAALSQSAPARAEEHKDAKLGYSVNYPRKWLVRPLSTSERWLVAKFESEREFEAASKEGYYTHHKPWLDVVVIPLNVKKSGTVQKEGDTIKIDLATQYKDLKEYLENEMQRRQGGFFFSKEEETTVNGLKCIQYELTFDKLVEQKTFVWAWAYYTPDCIYGLIGESWEKYQDKVRPDLMSAFKSFKAYPRTGGLPGGERTGEDFVEIQDPTKTDNTTEEDVKKKRDQKTNSRLARIKESLGSDWIVKESPNFVAVSHADMKYTKATLDHCEALRGWLDDNLGYVGNGYCGRVIIRICKDTEEHDAFIKSGSGWSGGGVEVATFKDRDGWSDWAMEYLNRRVFDIWFTDKNPAVNWAFPAWIESGLNTYIESAVSKGKKIEFRADVWERIRTAQAKRGGSLPFAKTFFTMTRDELWKSWEQGGDQAGSFVRFLVAGGAKRNPKFKNVFSDYVKAIVFIVDEEVAEQARARKAASGGQPQPSDEPKDEKEEEEQAKARAQQWSSREREFLDKVFQRVFADWKDEDWKSMTDSYWKDAK